MKSPNITPIFPWHFWCGCVPLTSTWWVVVKSYKNHMIALRTLMRLGIYMVPKTEVWLNVFRQGYQSFGEPYSFRTEEFFNKFLYPEDDCSKVCRRVGTATMWKNTRNDPEYGGAWFVRNIFKSPVYQIIGRHIRKSVVLMPPLELPEDR
jgi:hypothetical protein